MKALTTIFKFLALGVLFTSLVNCNNNGTSASSSSAIGTLAFSKSSETITVNSSNHVTLSLNGSSGVNGLAVTLSSSAPGIVTTTPSSCTLSSESQPTCEISLSSGSATGTAIITASAPGYTSTSMTAQVSNSTVNGTLSFTPSSQVIVQPGTTQTVYLALDSSSGISNLTANIASSNSNIAIVSPTQCTLSSSPITSRQCAVTIKGGTSTGTTTITATASNGSYTYTVTPLSVENNNSLNFSTQVTNLNSTVYTNQQYTPEFTFTNNASSPVTLGNAAISVSNSSVMVWTKETDTCSNQSIASGGTCKISGKLSMPTANTLSDLAIVLQQSGGSGTYTYSINVAAVAFKNGYVAFRMQSPYNTGHTAFVTVQSSTGLFQFDANGVGSAAACTNLFQDVSQQITTGSFGTVLYLPINTPGNKFWMSLDAKLYTTGNCLTQPSLAPVLSQNANTPWSYYENTIDPLTNGGTVAQTWSDSSNVNSISLPIGFGATNINTNVYTPVGPTTAAYADTPATTILGYIQQGLAAAAINPVPTWDIATYLNYNTTSPSQLVRVLGPSNWFGNATTASYPAGFNATGYNAFDDDVWAFYAQTGHNLTLDASEVHAGCVLVGHVQTDNLMHFAPQNAANCPDNYVNPVNGLNSGPNTFTMTKFTVQDWMSGAAGTYVTTYGANGTYRSMGKYIVAGQNIGYLPYCPGGVYDDIAYGKAKLQEVAALHGSFTQQYSCLANVASYGDSVINQYDKQNHIYFPYYGYTYDDAGGGIDNTVTSNGYQFPVTVIAGRFYN